MGWCKNSIDQWQDSDDGENDDDEACVYSMFAFNIFAHSSF